MSQIRKKQIAIGVEDFKEIIDKGAYFVDKTLMIKKLIECQAKVTLFTRPRRFGKTLNQFMIRRFFENEITEKGEKVDNGYLFDGLKITECGEEILKHQQQYPVIFMTLKSAKQPNFEMAYGALADEIYNEFMRHRYVLQSDALLPIEKERYENLLNRRADEKEVAKAFAFLSEYLFKYHGKKTIILIDEYDVPLENAYFEGFYDKMIKFICSLFESALKTNPYLERSVITGCLNSSTKSVFPEFSALKTDSILHTDYGDSFGLTEKEVKEMLAYFGLEEDFDEIKKWYGGYYFGEMEIYNPWSIMNYVSNRKQVPNFPRKYWANSSSKRKLIRTIVDAADRDKTIREELEILRNGGEIEKNICEQIAYEDISKSIDNVWNILFLYGYLATKETDKFCSGESNCLKLFFPNMEVQAIYGDDIRVWAENRIRQTDRSLLIQALAAGDCEAAETFIFTQLHDTICHFHLSYYREFLADLLRNNGYRVRYDFFRENEKPDIVITESKFRGRAMILELKISDTIQGMEKKCEEALTQIEEQKYAVPLEDDGYQPILKYAICFFKKGCMVKKAE